MGLLASSSHHTHPPRIALSRGWVGLQRPPFKNIKTRFCELSGPTAVFLDVCKNLNETRCAVELTTFSGTLDHICWKCHKRQIRICLN